MNLRGRFSSLIAYAFQNRSGPCNCRGLEKEMNGHLLSLKYRGGCLWPFTGSLWSFAGNLHSFPGGM